MDIEYVGTAYAGFQRQSRKPSVQAALESAILAVTGESVTLSTAGRTDAGAHACRQVSAFTTDSSLPANVMRGALNAHLPRDIAVTTVTDVQESFNPRYDAVSRTYRYLILNREARSPFWEARAWHIRSALDVSAMHAAAQFLVGRTDLGSFVPKSKPGSKVRTVFGAVCAREGDLVSIELRASGFMKQMTRAIVGTLVDIGLHRRDGAGFRSLIAAGDRSLAAPTAPACGLYLVDVQYDYQNDNQAPGLCVSGVPEEKG